MGAILACAVTVIGFVLVKTVEPVTQAYALAIGLLRWPVMATHSLIGGEGTRPVVPIDVVMDPTDLLTIVFVGASYFYLRFRIGERSRE